MALVIRLLVLRELGADDPRVYSPPESTDMNTYVTLSEDIYRNGSCGEFYFQPLYYAFFMPAIYVLTGGLTLGAVLFVQCVLGALTVWLTGLCTALMWNRTAGLIAALLVALCRDMIMYASYFQIETLKTFLLVLLLFTVILAYRRRSSFLWMTSGLVCGLIILARANAVVFFLSTLVLLLWPYLKKLRVKPFKIFNKDLAHILIFSFFAFVTVLPYCIYNSILAGDISGVSIAGPQIFALASNPESPSGSFTYSTTYMNWTSDGGKNVAKHFLKWLGEQPLAFSELYLRKLLLFWNAGEIPDNISFEKQKDFSFILRNIRFIPAGFYISLFFSALICFAGKIFRKPTLIYLVLLVAIYWLVMGFFSIVTRYRVAILPLLAVFSGIFIYAACRKYFTSTKKSPVARFFLIAMAFSFMATYFGYDAYRFNLEKYALRIARPNGDVIDLGDRIMMMDHGPLAQGSWKFFLASPGDAIVKKIPVPGIHENFKLDLIMKFPSPGGIKIVINGYRYEINENAPALKGYTFRVGRMEDGVVEINVLENQAGTEFAVDFQRDYGRTIINGKNPGGELVERIFLPKVPEK